MEGFVEALGRLAFPVAHAPVGIRVVVGVVAAGVLLAGGRLGRDGVRLAAMLAGALLTAAVLDAAGAPERYLQPWSYGGVVFIAMASALWVERLGHRLALFVVGVVCGAFFTVALRDAFGGGPSPWWAGAGSLVVGLILPWVFETVPRFLSPLPGAVALAWALGLPGSLPLIVGLWALGLGVQLFTGPARVDLELEDRERERTRAFH